MRVVGAGCTAVEGPPFADVCVVGGDVVATDTVADELINVESDFV